MDTPQNEEWQRHTYNCECSGCELFRASERDAYELGQAEALAAEVAALKKERDVLREALDGLGKALGTVTVPPGHALISATQAARAALASEEA